jgi:hypothetical protein
MSGEPWRNRFALNRRFDAVNRAKAPPASRIGTIGLNFNFLSGNYDIDTAAK